MAGWQDLAVEIIADVLQHLDTSDYLSTSLVSFQFRSITDRFLYHSVTLKSSKSCPGALYHSPQYCFLRTLSNRPYLRSLVRGLTLGPFKDVIAPDADECKELRTMLQHIEKRHYLAFGSPIMERVKDCRAMLEADAEFGREGGGLANFQSIDYFLQLIILQIPRLESLIIPTYSFVPMCVLEGSGLKPAYMDTMRSLEVSKVHSAFPALLPLLSSSTLRTAKFADITLLSGALPQLQKELTQLSAQYAPFRVTRLALNPAGMPEMPWVQFFQLFERLEAFTFVIRAQGYFEAAELASGLALHKSSLSSIEIRVDPTWSTSVSESLGSFASYPLLTSLKTEARMLLGSLYDAPDAPPCGNTLEPLLPYSLKRLELTLVNSWELEAFPGVSGIPAGWRGKAALPNLGTFILHGVGANCEDVEELKELVGRFDVAGIEART